MRRLAVAVPVALLLSVMPALAMAQAAPPAGQAPGQPKPTPTAPAQPGQKPAPTAPAQPAPKPVQPPIAAQPPSPPKPFPQGAKVAFVNLQAVFQLSADGKAAAAKVQSLTTQKQAQIAERQKVLQANQQKLQTGGTLMNEQARGQLEKDVEKQTRELERFQQDAQAGAAGSAGRAERRIPEEAVPGASEDGRREGPAHALQRRRCRSDLG